jgi:YfiH family protein
MHMHEMRATADALKDTDWLVPQWPVASRVRAFVTTRNGGVSTGPCASLNLGHGGDDAAAVAENRRRVQQHLPAAPSWLRQVHGARVVDLSAQDRSAPTADAAVTRTPSVPLVVMIADCLPVLLAQRSGAVVGIAHAGWRGLSAGVVERTALAMRCAPRDLVAWIGPGIGPQAFEVGRDVYDAFVQEDPSAAEAFAPLREGKWLADLPRLARRRLARLGITDVHGGTWCTVRDPARFFSYRRDGVSGRMGAFIWIDPAP